MGGVELSIYIFIFKNNRDCNDFRRKNVVSMTFVINGLGLINETFLIDRKIVIYRHLS